MAMAMAMRRRASVNDARARSRRAREGDAMGGFDARVGILMVCLRFFSRAQSEEEALVGVPRKKNPYKKFSYRGVDLEGLLEMKNDKLVTLFNARIRRRCVFVM
mmetsp:Transcript_8774/g.29625  ORF Transcript_8774/g.29625 Transcript_8774/m.29625 type:complete len:104 (+) Transcript_8774:320-631(+)